MGSRQPPNVRVFGTSLTRYSRCLQERASSSEIKDSSAGQRYSGSYKLGNARDISDASTFAMNMEVFIRQAFTRVSTRSLKQVSSPKQLSYQLLCRLILTAILLSGPNFGTCFAQLS